MTPQEKLKLDRAVDDLESEVTDAIAAAVDAEREACAKACDDAATRVGETHAVVALTLVTAAGLIRARGKEGA